MLASDKTSGAFGKTASRHFLLEDYRHVWKLLDLKVVEAIDVTCLGGSAKHRQEATKSLERPLPQGTPLDGLMAFPDFSLRVIRPNHAYKLKL